MPGWTTAHVPLFLLLPLLLVASGFFSGSETALFGLSHNERASVPRGGVAARSIEILLREPRMLLITVLLGNMVVNVLYFVISSVLVLEATGATVLAQVLMAAGSLVLIILIGEVLPKLIANSNRIRFASLTAPPLVALFTVLAPLRSLIDTAVVTPLSRLTAPRDPPPQLDHVEFATLFEVSGREGVLDVAEQEHLERVVNLGRLRVRHVMTPRVRVAALPIEATREDVIALARETRLTKFPVVKGDLDHIVGVLHVKRFLLDEDAKIVRGSAAMLRPRFIPELATLDHLLEDFRRTHTQIAIAVDEYGGTAGIVAVEDIVHEIVGELREQRSEGGIYIEQLDHARWRVAGDADIRDLERVLYKQERSREPASVGGLIAAQLSRVPEPGDTVALGPIICEVEEVAGTRIRTAIITYFETN